MSKIANLNCTLECSHVCTSMQITDNPSNNMTLSGSETLLDGAKVTLLGIKSNADSSAICTTLEVTLNATSTKVTCKSGLENKKVILVGDSGTASGEFTNTSTGATYTESVTVMVKAAYQSEVSGK